MSKRIQRPAQSDWEPKRDGKIYCSPGCGRGCTWKEYRAAIRDGMALAKVCGPVYKYRVYENLGWHFEAISPCGRIRVFQDSVRGWYWAGLGRRGEVGMLYVSPNVRSPKLAIKTVVT